jgi:Zn-dependent protease with chaperone function
VKPVSFFAQQDRARSASRTLVLLYVLSVAAIVACVNLAVIPVYVAWSDLGKALETSFVRGPLRVYALAPSYAYAAASLVTLAIIAMGTIEILARLSLGRGEFAELLSGRPVGRDSGRDDERRLVNIVDELSIASGLQAPPLYVLNREQGINAFAAGATPGQAVIIVTQGALERLSRDELQAVIAHEFSHILNGDIQLNLRAVYVLQGIVFLSAIGRFMMQYYSGAGTEEGRSFFSLPFAAVGVGVYAVGSVGLFFCRIIQASISRERENLADASAVRFTRNADALCGALARIAVNGEGSRLRNWHADALAHMLFAPPSPGWLSALIATHPPLEERMRRINPHVSPNFYFERARKPRAIEEGKKQSPAPESEKPRTIVPRRVTGVAALIAGIGAPQAEHLEYAQDLLAYLSPSIREALRDPLGAQSVMLGFVLEEELTMRNRQLNAIDDAGFAGTGLARKVENIAPALRQLDRAYRLPLVALAAPVLKRVDEPGRAAFLAALRAVIQADERVTLSEFVLATILEWSFGPHSRRAAIARYRERRELAPEISLVLSLLAYCGSGTGEDAQARAQAAFDKGRGVLGLAVLALVARDALQLSQVSLAFERLAELATAEKERMLEAFGAAVAADEDVRLMEHELLRAVACVLDCPMPPATAALDPRLLRK